MYVYVKLNMFTKGVFWWAMEARRVEQALVVTVTEGRSGAKWQRMYVANDFAGDARGDEAGL